ncbi:MAG: LacI family DNA-binding transcriptional regulator [Flexilinea sp.]
MVTILDVAKEANVSASTVSRVLNNTGTISQNTVDCVYKAVEKLGYEPNVLARSFRKKETRTILILTPNMTNPYYSNIISGISDMSRGMSYSSFICNTTGGTDQVKETLDMLPKHRADGAILLASEKGEKWLKDYADEFPVIQCSEYDPEIPIPHVSIDNYQAAIEAVRLLICLGHKKIGTISSVNNYLSTELRLKGYRDALLEAGIEPSDRYVSYAGKDYNYQSGCKAAETLLSQRDRPTALFCISDVLAIGAINTAKQMGLSIPHDVSVIGFDDVEQTAMFSPKITTVAQPCYTLGQKSAELLCRNLAAGETVPMETILSYKMIVRESTGLRPY